MDKYVEFCKALENAKIIRKGSHKSEEVIKTIKEVCEATDDELKAYNGNQAVMMIHDEFSDWIETYQGEK